MSDGRAKVVIIGAGFGGLAAAKALEHPPEMGPVIDQLMDRLDHPANQAALPPGHPDVNGMPPGHPDIGSPPGGGP